MGGWWAVTDDHCGMEDDSGMDNDAVLEGILTCLGIWIIMNWENLEISAAMGDGVM